MQKPLFLDSVSLACFVTLSLVEFRLPGTFILGFVYAYSVSLFSYVGSTLLLLLAVVPFSVSSKYLKGKYRHRISSVSLKTSPSVVRQLQTVLVRQANNRSWSIMNHLLDTV